MVMERRDAAGTLDAERCGDRCQAPPGAAGPVQSQSHIEHLPDDGRCLHSLLRDEYWHAPSRAVLNRLGDLEAGLERMLDLSEIPPAARYQLGRDGNVYLYDVLSRIELPPTTDIPDAADYPDAGDEKEAGGGKTVSWTIPHTEITLVRVADGPKAGEFLFSSSTVARALEFYEKTRTLPYRRDVPLKNYPEMRPYLSMKGWMVSSRIIEGFPNWLKRSVYEQAVWKWIALAMLTALTAVVIVVIHRLAQPRLSGNSAGLYLRRLVTPLALLLMPLVLDLANQQLTLTGLGIRKRHAADRSGHLFRAGMDRLGGLDGRCRGDCRITENT